MDTRLLTTFVYVAELASFTRQLLRWAMPSLRCLFRSNSWRRSWAAKLFERINHTVALTDSGREVLQYAHRINQLSEEMLRSVLPGKTPGGPYPSGGSGLSVPDAAGHAVPGIPPPVS